MSTSTITIRNVPDEVLTVLRARARRSGESMQAYIWKRLVADASRPSPAEAMERVEARLENGCYPVEPIDVEAAMNDGQA